MLRFITAGESHGCCLTAIVEGLPAGLKIDLDHINNELARRQKGFGRGGRMQIENDKAKITSGVRFGSTIGSPLTVEIQNKDWENWRQRMAVFGEPDGERMTCPRPGHADFSGSIKYERHDIRDVLERASARETAARVAVGAIAKQLLAVCGVDIFAHVTSIGNISIGNCQTDHNNIKKAITHSELACSDAIAEEQMKQRIREAQQVGDTVGGTFEIRVTGVLPGLGSYVQWDRRLDTKLTGAIMSIPGIKGVEVGVGFQSAALLGSEVHDQIFFEPGKGYFRKTNHAGGLEGGMSNGEDIIVKAAMKPIPTLMRPLSSVDMATHQAVSASKERSDVCAVPAAAVVGEAMTALVLASCLLEKFPGDTIADLQAAVAAYTTRLKEIYQQK